MGELLMAMRNDHAVGRAATEGTVPCSSVLKPIRAATVRERSRVGESLSLVVRRIMVTPLKRHGGPLLDSRGSDGISLRLGKRFE